MGKSDEIIQRFEEFRQYLASIDVEELRKGYSRVELYELKKSIDPALFRNLAYEIVQIAEQKKREEFPQLDGVYRYPILNEIDFLSEDKKIALDKHLGLHKVGDYVKTLWRIIPDVQVRNYLERWLEERGVIEKRYQALCPNCNKESISRFMSKDERNKLEESLSKYKNGYSEELYDYLDSMLQMGCNACDEFAEFEKMNDLTFKATYVLAMKRDTTLDNA